MKTYTQAENLFHALIAKIHLIDHLAVWYYQIG